MNSSTLQRMLASTVLCTAITSAVTTLGAEPWTYLSGPAPQGDNQYLPDTRQFIFSDTIKRSNRLDLYIRSIDGSDAPVSIGPSLTSTEVVTDFFTSPADNTAVYITNLRKVFTGNLRGGGAPILKHTFPSPAATEVHGYLSPNAKQVVFRTYPNTGSAASLWSLPMDSSTSMVSLYTPQSSSELFGGFNFSPDSSRIVLYERPTSTSEYRIFTRPVDGTQAAVELGTSLSSTLSVQGGAEFAQNSQSVFFTSTNSTGTNFVHRQGAQGGSISTILPPSGLQWQGFWQQLNDTTYRYLAGTSTTSYDLYRQNFGPNQPVRITTGMYDGPLYTTGKIQPLMESPDKLFYQQEISTGQYAMFSFTLDGTNQRTQVSGAFSKFGSVVYSPDDRHAIFRGNFDRPGFTDLYYLNLDGTAIPQRISTLASNERLFDLETYDSPDNNWALYRVKELDSPNYGRIEAVRTDGTSGPIVLATIPRILDVDGAQFTIDDFWGGFTSDMRYLLIRVYDDDNNVIQYSTPFLAAVPEPSAVTAVIVIGCCGIAVRTRKRSGKTK